MQIPLDLNGGVQIRTKETTQQNRWRKWLNPIIRGGISFGCGFSGRYNLKKQVERLDCQDRLDILLEMNRVGVMNTYECMLRNNQVWSVWVGQ